MNVFVSSLGLRWRSSFRCLAFMFCIVVENGLSSYKYGAHILMKTKTLALVAILAGLANVMSLPPLAIPIQIGGFSSSLHFFQLAIFLCGIISGPGAGFACGIVGSLYMGLTRIPFVVGGIAILGLSVGFFSKRVRPVFAGLLSWLIQAPYVLVTDYFWFTVFAGNSSSVAWAIIIPVMANLTLQAVICAILADIIIHYLKRVGVDLATWAYNEE